MVKVVLFLIVIKVSLSFSLKTQILAGLSSVTILPLPDIIEMAPFLPAISIAGGAVNVELTQTNITKARGIPS